jgi:hypothetical protein
MRILETQVFRKNPEAECAEQLHLPGIAGPWVLGQTNDLLVHRDPPARRSYVGCVCYKLRKDHRALILEQPRMVIQPINSLPS